MKGIAVWNFGITETLSIKDYVEYKIVDNDTQGTSEAAASNADRAQVALAKLCQVLTDKGLLSAEEIVEIADTFESDCSLVDIES